MRTRGKVGIGCLVIVLAIVGIGAFKWFNREPRPIVVAEAGAGGERVMLGDTPANYFPGSGGGPRIGPAPASAPASPPRLRRRLASAAASPAASPLAACARAPVFFCFSAAVCHSAVFC